MNTYAYEYFSLSRKAVPPWTFSRMWNIRENAGSFLSRNHVSEGGRGDDKATENAQHTSNTKCYRGKCGFCLDDSRFAGYWIIPRIFISLDEAKSFKRRNFAHLSVHSPNICQWYGVFIKLALHCSFQLVLKIYFIVESTLHDTLGGVIQSYTRSGAQKQRGERRF